MKSVFISIRPEWCEKIASGKKTIEARKTRPKLTEPFKCYIYQTHRGQKEGRLHSGVIGEFICDKIITVDCDSVAPFDRETKEYADKETCLSREELWKYSGGRCVFGWHISDLKIYDEPKTLSGFCTLKRPPQSWCYIKES